MVDAAIKLELPVLKGRSLNPGASSRNAPVGNDQIKREAYAEGLEQGRARGHQLGLEQAGQELEHLRQIMNYLHQPLVDLDNQVLESLAALAVRLAGQLVHRQLQQDPAGLIPIISAAVEQLPLNSERPRVLLNPKDLELVAAQQSEQPVVSSWVLVADAAIKPGECQVAASMSRVDLGLDARLNNLLATLLDEDAPLQS